MAKVCLTEAGNWNKDPPRRRQSAYCSQSCGMCPFVRSHLVRQNYAIGTNSSDKVRACLGVFSKSS